MRIALLSYEFPPDTGFGGIGTYTWHQARALAKLGHDVHVLAGARAATPLQAEELDGVRVYRFWADGAVMRTAAALGRLQLWWTRQRLQNAWSMYRGLAALHRQHRYDVIEMPECGAEGGLVTRRLEVPTVVRLHSPAELIMPFYEVRRTDTILCSALERPALVRGTAITACSRFVAAAAARELHVDRPMAVIPNGLDLDWFDTTGEPADVHRRYGLPRRPLMILFAGRMERRKGIHLCPQIAASILERYDVSFVFAGDDLFGYMQQTLLPALAGRRLKGSVHWLGPLPLPEVRRLARACDIFLLPSLWENCPYSCLEAMAAGRAVIAADQGGMPELIADGVTGVLAASGDPAAFIRAIERLMHDAELRGRLGVAARQAVERSHRDTDIASRSVTLYETVAAGRPAA